jgi:hypothetical protein
MYLAAAAATFASAESAAAGPGLREVLESALRTIEESCRQFLAGGVSPESAFDFERRLQGEIREVARRTVEWTFNAAEAEGVELPSHAVFDGGLYTRLKSATPREVSTLFGEVALLRTGYRDTHKSGEPSVFPAERALGIAGGATAAAAECAARYQAEAGATQRRTLLRLKEEHGLAWGVKKLRAVVGRVSAATAEVRPAALADRLLELLEKAHAGRGRKRPVLAVGRDGITLGVPVKNGTVFEVAAAATVSVYGRRGQRLGTVYLAHVPEPKQGTMGAELTALLADVLRRWEKALPRLAYVTDAGDNESAYYGKVLRRMKHPETGKRLEWVRVVDFYHAASRLWTMAEALFGAGPAASAWARRMRKLLKQPNGVRRVLNSASALRARHALTGNRAKEFGRAYEYLRSRTKFMRYAEYEAMGVPRGSGVTEAACKTVFTQRLKLSGMRWKKAGAQTVLDLRVLVLSGVWPEAYRRTLRGFKTATVPAHAVPPAKSWEIAA